MCNQAAMVVQILFATRELGLSERGVGLSYVGLGAGTIGARMIGNRVVRCLGSGRTLTLGFAITGTGWLLLAVAPLGAAGIAAYVAMLLLFGLGAVFITINFLALRQSVTPAPLLGRMTSTMRWLILLPSAPGALLGGWFGQHWGLRWSLGFGGGTALLLALVASRLAVITNARALPTLRAEAIAPYSADGESN
jgi:MFS family permease